jgi:hypothetical protein
VQKYPPQERVVEALHCLRDLAVRQIRLERKGGGWVLTGRPEPALAERLKAARADILTLIETRPNLLYWKLSQQLSKIGLPGVHDKTPPGEFVMVHPAATHFSLPVHPVAWIPIGLLPASYWGLKRFGSHEIAYDQPDPLAPQED